MSASSRSWRALSTTCEPPSRTQPLANLLRRPRPTRADQHRAAPAPIRIAPSPPPHSNCPDPSLTAGRPARDDHRAIAWRCTPRSIHRLIPNRPRSRSTTVPLIPDEAYIAAEETLVGDARRRLVARRHLRALPWPRSVAAARAPSCVPLSNAAGVFVDDLHLVVAQDVVHVALVKVQRGQGLLDDLLAGAAVRQVPPSAAEPLGQPSRPDCVSSSAPRRPGTKCSARPAAAGRRHQAPRGSRVGGGLVALGDDQRRARLVDQHAVCLVDDGETQPARGATRCPPAHRTARPGGCCDGRAGGRGRAGRAEVEGDLLAGD